VRKFFALPLQILDLLTHQCTECGISFFLADRVTNAAPRKEIRTIAYITMIVITPANEL
jgi:hypothetical protein